jgi:hypothetical protein
MDKLLGEFLRWILGRAFDVISLVALVVAFLAAAWRVIVVRDRSDE